MPSLSFSEMSTITRSGLASRIAQRSVDVLTLAANDQVGFVVHQLRQPLPHDRMIVNNKEPAFRLIGWR